MGNIIPSNNNDNSNFNPTKLPGCRIWIDGTDLSGTYSTDYQGEAQVSGDFVPTSISGCATWFDSSDTSTLYQTSAGPVTAASSPTEINGCVVWLDGADDTTKYSSYAGPVTAISSPLDISGCSGWWDASDISSMFQDAAQTVAVISNGDPVAVLRDKSGSNIHAIQSTLTSSRPIYTANLSNNKSGLFFDGGDFLLANRPASSTHTVLAVLYPAVTLMHAASPISINHLACFHPQGGGINWFASDTGNYLNGSYNFDFYPQIVGWTNNNSSVTGYKNSYVAFAGMATTNVSTDSGLQLGRRGDGYAYFTGYICEVVYYNKVLTTSERASVEQYFVNKWRIDQIHGSSLSGPVVAETSPLNINGCSLWLDASESSSVVEIDGAVSQWSDKSGNNRHAIQSNPNSRPTKSGSQNGLSVITFDGFDDTLTSPLQDSDTQTIFWIAKTTGPSDYSLLLSYNGSAGNRTISVGNGGIWKWYGPNINSTQSASSYAVMSAVVSGSNKIDLYQTGSFVGTANPADQLGFSPNNLSIASTGAYPYKGEIAEIIVYNRALSNYDRMAIERYLDNKWIGSGIHTQSIPNKVGYWGDKSGNGYHAKQTLENNRPSISSFPASSNNSILFTKSQTQYLTIDNYPYSASNNYTFFILLKPNTLSSNDVVLGKNHTTCFGTALWSSSGITLRSNGGGQHALYNDLNPSVLTISRSSSTSHFIFRNGDYLTHFATSANSTSVADLLSSIGASCNGNYPYDGYIGEIIVFDRQLSLSERGRVEKYLLNKWNFADPHVSTPPGGSIGCWLDKSGNNRNATQTIGPYRPSRLGTINGLQAITFDGTNDYFSLGDLSSAYPNFGEIFIVFEPNNATTYELYQSVNNYPIYRYADSTSSFGAFTSTRATPGQIVGPTTGVHITSMRANSSNMTVRLDGNVWHTQNGLGYNGGWAHYIGFSDQGSGGVGGVVMNGKIVEVISYNRDIGSADRARVEQYLARKWGISNSLHGKTNLTNDRIGYIPNKGSLNTYFSQINHHNRPRIGTLNGRSAFDFTRSSANAYLQTPQQPLGSTSWSFFVVYRTNNTNTTVYTYGVQDALLLISRYPNNTVTYGGTNTVFYARPLPTNTTIVESLIKSSGGTGVNQTKLYRYGVDCVATSTSGAGTEASINYGWFVLNGYNSPYTGQGYNTSIIGEFIVYDRALSGGERQLIEKYLHDKWNLDQATNMISKPTDISGCSLWLDCDDIDTLFKDPNAATPVLVDGDSVAYWADKVGGQDVIQATVAARPTYKTNIQNGKSMIYFDGGDDLLSQVNRLYSAPCTLFVVCRIDSHSGDISGIFTHGDNTGGLNGPGFCYIGSTAAGDCLVFLDGAGAGTTSSSNTSSSMLGLPRIITGVYNQSNTSNSLIYTNGNLEENFTGTGVSVSTTTNRIQIGARTGGGWNSRRMIGYVAECIRYDRVLSSSERASVENYLSAKWGIGSYSSPNSIGSAIIRHKIKVSNKDAQNWIDRVFANGGSVSEKTADSVNEFCKQIESAGLRKKFYRLNLFCGNDLQACLTPLYLGPDSDRFYGFRTESNTGFFQNNYDEKNGLIAGPGSSTGGNGIYLLTGVSLSDMGLSSTGHMAFYQTQFNLDTNPYNAGNRPIIGAGNTLIALQGSNSTLSYYGEFNSIESAYFGGLYILTRNSSSDMKSYEAGVLRGSQTGSITIPEQTSTIGIFTSTNGSVASGPNYYFGYVKGYSVGQSMTQQEVSQYNTIMESFQTSLGRGLPTRSSAQFSSVTNEETKSWIDAVYANGGTVSSATALAVDNFCNSMDAAGLRNKFYRINLFCGGNLASCLVPLYRGPSRLGIRYGNARDINVLNTAGSNNFDYSESDGLLGNTQDISGNGFISRRYLRTGLITGSVTELNNNLHSAVYTKSLTVGGYPIGAYDSGSTGFSLQIGIGGYNVGAFANALLNFTNTSTTTLYPSNKGLYIGNYSGYVLTAYEGRANVLGQRDLTSTYALNPTTASDIGIFGEYRQNNGIALFNYLDRLQGYSIGTSLSSSDVESYYDIMQTFQAALSRANIDPTLGSQFDSITNLDTRDWLTRVYKNGGTVSVATATAVQNFCNSIDSAGIRSRFYRLNLFCGDNLEACTVPLYRGDSRTGPQRGFLYDIPNNITISDYNESGILSGIKGNGLNKYLATGLGTDFTNSSSLSFGAFITSPTETAFSTYLGVAQNTNTNSTVLYYRDGFTRGLDGTTFYPSAPNNSILTGHHIYSRISGSSYFHGWNGISGTTSNSAAAVRGFIGFVIHANNNNGTITGYGNGRISMYHIGLGLTTQEVSAFNNALVSFNAEMGRTRPSSQFASVTNEDAKIWIDNVYSNGGTVSTATASAVNTLCDSINSNNLRNKFYRMNLFCGNNLAACLVPLYRGTDRTLIYGNPVSDSNNNFISSDFNENSGLIGNGSTKWLDTGLSQNFATYKHFGFVMNKLPSVAYRVIMGAKANTASDFISDTRIQTDGTTTTVSYLTGSDSGQLSVSISLPIAEKTFVIGVSDSDNNNKLYADVIASNNRPSYSTSNTTSIGVFAQKIGQNNSGTSHTDARLSLYTIGLNLSSSEISTLTSIIDSFNDALNRGKPSNTFTAVTNSEVKRWIDAAYTNGGTISTSTADAVNVFANTIDSIGIRSKIYRLNLMCGSNLAAALVPLYRGPNTNTLLGNYYDVNNTSFSYNDSLSSLSSKGIGSGGGSGKLDTGLKTTMLPSLQTAHFAVAAQWSSGGPGNPDIGWNLPGIFKLSVGIFSAVDFSVCHSTDSINIPSFRSSFPTRAIASRTNSGIIINIRGTNNTYTLAPETISGTITSSFTIFGFGTDSTGIAGNGAGNISFYSVGSSLTQTEVDDFDNALRIFLESIGRLNPA